MPNSGGDPRDQRDSSADDYYRSGHGYKSPERLPCTTAEQSVPVPIAYGSCKVPIRLVEKTAPGDNISYPNWQASHAYYVNDHVRHAIGSLDGVTYYNVYQCITAGTSAGSGGPSTEDNDITDGSCHWGFTGNSSSDVTCTFQCFLGLLAEGEISGALGIWINKVYQDAGSLTEVGAGLQCSVGPDACNQWLASPWVIYQHSAIIYNKDSTSFSSGTANEIPDMAVAIKGVMFGASSSCVSPADIIADLVTHARRGCGMPSGYIHTSITGSGVTTYRTYCDAIGFRLSLFIDSQQTALALISAVLAATNSEGFWSQGALKVSPRGDTAITSPVYGVVNYSPNKAAVYDLGPDDFLGTPPVQCQRHSDADCYNAIPVEYYDISQGWAKTVVEDADQADVERRGIRRTDTVATGMIFPDGQAGVLLSRILAQRNVYARNRYSFKLGWRFLRLEPTDIVTITEPVLGLSLVPVKIVEMTESIDGIEIVAEDYPQGVSAASGYVPAPNTGYLPGATERRTTGDLNLGRVQDVKSYRRITGVAASNKSSSSSIASSAVGPAQSVNHGMRTYDNRNAGFIRRTRG